MGCNYLSLSEIPVSGTKGLKSYGTQERLNPTTASSCQNQSWYIMLWASVRSCNGVEMCFPKTPYNFACWRLYVMTSSNGDIFRVTGPLCGEFTGQRWIPLTGKGQWRGDLMFSLICAWTNGWVNNGNAGDLRRHRAHYDVTVMTLVSYDVFCGLSGDCVLYWHIEFNHIQIMT